MIYIYALVMGLNITALLIFGAALLLTWREQDCPRPLLGVIITLAIANLSYIMTSARFAR